MGTHMDMVTMLPLTVLMDSKSLAAKKNKTVLWVKNYEVNSQLFRLNIFKEINVLQVCSKGHEPDKYM
jgi:hypothetical protein